MKKLGGAETRFSACLLKHCNSSRNLVSNVSDILTGSKTIIFKNSFLFLVPVITAIAPHAEPPSQSYLRRVRLPPLASQKRDADLVLCEVHALDDAELEANPDVQSAGIIGNGKQVWRQI